MPYRGNVPLKRFIARGQAISQIPMVGNKSELCTGCLQIQQGCVWCELIAIQGTIHSAATCKEIPM